MIHFLCSARPSGGAWSGRRARCGGGPGEVRADPRTTQAPAHAPHPGMGRDPRSGTRPGSRGAHLW